jgi:hypothetical protein
MRRVRIQAEEEKWGKETNIKSKPRVGSTEEDFEVPELTKVGSEIGPAGLGGVDSLEEIFVVLVGGFSSQDILDVAGGLVNVALNIHGKTGSLWDSQTEVESDDSWNSTETDQETPHEIDGVEVCYVGVFE